MPEVNLDIKAQFGEVLAGLKSMSNSLDKLDEQGKEFGSNVSEAFNKVAAGASKAAAPLKQQRGLIEDIEQSIKEWEITQHKATDVKDIEKYNRKIAEAKQHLQEYQTKGLPAMKEVNKQATLGEKVFNKLGATIAAAFSVHMIINFAKKAWEAYQSQLKAETKLLTALKGRKEAQQDLIEQARKLQQTSGIADDEIIRAQAAMTKQFGQNADAIKALMPLVVDWAAFNETDVVSAAEQVSKAVYGSGMEFKRMGITLEGSKGSVERFDGVMQILNKTVKGQATALKDAEGGIADLRVVWDEFLESTGKKLKDSGVTEFLDKLLSGNLFTGIFGKDYGIRTGQYTKSQRDNLLEIFKTIQDKFGYTFTQIGKDIAPTAEKLEAWYKLAKSFEDQSKKTAEQIAARYALIKDYNDKMLLSNARLQELAEAGDEVAAEILENRQAAFKLNSENYEIEQALFALIEASKGDVLQFMDDQITKTDELTAAEEDRLNKLRKLYDEIQIADEEYVDDISWSTSEVVKGLDEIKKKAEDLAKFKKENPILGWLGIENEEQKKLLFDGIENVKNAILSIAEAQLEATEIIVDTLNTRIDEQQNALQTEIALNEQGYASNIAIEKKKLADLKAEREKALQEQAKAARRQANIEAFVQMVNTATSVTEIIKGFVKTNPLIGVILAAANIAAMFATMSAAKSKAAAMTKFAKGGILDGKSHGQGGIQIPGTGVEVEGGEYVVNKQSTQKYLPLVKAINEDDVQKLNAMIQVDRGVNVFADMDKSKKLDKIHILLKENLERKQVQDFGKYRVEKYKNRTRIVHKWN